MEAGSMNVNCRGMNFAILSSCKHGISSSIQRLNLNSLQMAVLFGKLSNVCGLSGMRPCQCPAPRIAPQLVGGGWQQVTHSIAGSRAAMRLPTKCT